MQLVIMLTLIVPNYVSSQNPCSLPNSHSKATGDFCQAMTKTDLEALPAPISETYLPLANSVGQASESASLWLSSMILAMQSMTQ